MKFLAHKKDISEASALLGLDKGKRTLAENDQRLLLTMIGNTALAGSSGLAIDPTVERKEAEECRQQADDVGLAVECLPIGAETDARSAGKADYHSLNFACETASREFFNSASDVEAHKTATASGPYDGRPFLADAARAFGAKLVEIANCADSDSMDRLGSELMSNEKLRGNKFLAGLALNDATQMENESNWQAMRAPEVAARWEALPEDRQQIVMTEFITGFRQFLFFNLSSEVNAIYPCNDTGFLRKTQQLESGQTLPALCRLLSKDNPSPADDDQEGLDFSAIGCHVLKMACERDIGYKELLAFASHYGEEHDLNEHVKAARLHIQGQRSADDSALIDRLKAQMEKEETPIEVIFQKATEIATVSGTFTIAVGAVPRLLAAAGVEVGDSSMKGAGDLLVDAGALTTVGSFIAKFTRSNDRRFATTMKTLKDYSDPAQVGGYVVPDLFEKMIRR